MTLKGSMKAFQHAVHMLNLDNYPSLPLPLSPLNRYGFCGFAAPPRAIYRKEGLNRGFGALTHK
jgi:hypothetical protein